MQRAPRVGGERCFWQNQQGNQGETLLWIWSLGDHHGAWWGRQGLQRPGFREPRSLGAWPGQGHGLRMEKEWGPFGAGAAESKEITAEG